MRYMFLVYGREGDFAEASPQDRGGSKPVIGP